MSAPDMAIILAYMLGMLAVGAWFMRRQRRVEEYFVGDRSMGAGHISLSVVATDVGGGFSIGLGGLGFAMGLSGSWLLFTGLIGAWLSAVLLIPRVKVLGDRHGWLTFPDFLEHRFDGRTRLVAALVSGLGYFGFVGAQILAGAKLAAVAFDIDMNTAMLAMGLVVVVYTSFGGLQAVIYTDTVQWLILLAGLLFLAIPFAWVEVGGLDAILATLPEDHLSLTNVSALELVTWGLTIIPIWFVGMTLYQRIYASRDLRTARRAWFLAGLLEYPIMAFAGSLLGLLARVMFSTPPGTFGPDIEPEMGLPMLIRDVLPVGVVGLVMAAYFSAIMSTADSCLLASVGNFINDLYQRYIGRQASHSKVLLLSRLLTVVLGMGSIGLAMVLPNVLELVLLAYSFMVCGLFVPTITGLLWKRASTTAAFWSMVTGGTLAVVLNLVSWAVPGGEPILYALPASAVVMVVLTLLRPAREPARQFDPG